MAKEYEFETVPSDCPLFARSEEGAQVVSFYAGEIRVSPGVKREPVKIAEFDVETKKFTRPGGTNVLRHEAEAQIARDVCGFMKELL